MPRRKVRPNRRFNYSTSGSSDCDTPVKKASKTSNMASPKGLPIVSDTPLENTQ